MTESGHHNDIGGTVTGPVPQARTVTAHTTPRQFPPPHPVWTNRAHELAALDELAAGTAPTWALLTGLGGIGKTELAVHWLTRQRADHPDGELYADLSAWRDQLPARPDQVLAGWLQALGVPPDDLPADLSELTAFYRSITAEKSLLVLVDNAFSAEQVRPLIPASPSSTIFATSRRQLRGLLLAGFRPVDLTYFTPDTGGTLLATLLGQPSLSDLDELRALASRGHGHPFALAVAGARLAANPHRRQADLIQPVSTPTTAPAWPCTWTRHPWEESST